MSDPDVRRFRRLLCLYPRSYRDRYEEELLIFFGEERAEGGRGAAFWARQFADHAKAAFSVRRRDWRAREEGGMMGDWVQDVRLSIRRLRRAPAFAGFAVATLALGIGATASVFTLLDRVALRPLPYPASDRLVIIGSDFSHDPGGMGPLSIGQLQDLMTAPGPAEDIVGATQATMTMTDMGEPERVTVNRVSGGFFEFLGAGVALGRLVGVQDQLVGEPQTAMISHGFWIDRFGGDAAAIGSDVILDGQAFVLVGVISPDFVPPESVAGDGSIWVPARFGESGASEGAFSIRALARLPEISQLGAFADYVDARFTERHDFLLGGTVREYQEFVVGGVGGRLNSAMAGVLLLLLIACVNVASLTLTRVEIQSREMAVRSALGAGRRRLVRQLLTESGLLALAGGLVGAALAFWAVELFRTHSPGGLPRMGEVGVDALGLGFAFALSLVTLVLFGVVPALASVRKVESGLAGMAGRAIGGRRRVRARAGLVLLETALAVVLVVGSGLLANDLVRLSAEDSGFRPDGLTSMRVELAGRVEGREQLMAFWTELLESAQAMPGVTSAALTTQLPYDGIAVMRRLTPEGFGEEEGPFVATVSVTADVFDVLGIEVTEGRALTPREATAGSPVAIVNEAFAREHWGDGGVLGKTIGSGDEMDDDRVVYSVIGVVGDVRSRAGVSPLPQVFIPLAAEPARRLELVVRTSDGSEGPAAGLRAAARRLDPGLPISRIRTVEAVAAAALDRPRFYAVLFGGFSFIALLLALIGIYGTTAYVARAGVREIGIRLALGAARRRLVVDVVGGTTRALILGVGLGLAAAALTSRALGDVLLYVTPHDVLTYAGVGVLMLAIGTFAAWLPASRASRVDPAVTLRQE